MPPNSRIGRAIFGTPEYTAGGQHVGNVGGLVNAEPLKKVTESIKKVQQGFNSLFDSMLASINKVQGALSGFVAASNPALVQQFTLALHDLHGVIGNILAPAFKNFTGVVRTVADALQSLSGPAKELLSGLLLGSTLAAVLGTVVAGITAFVTILGGLPALVIGVSTAIAGLLLTSGAFSGVIEKAKEIFSSIGGVFEQIATNVGPSLLRIGNAVVKIFDAMWKAAEPFVAIGEQIVSDIFEAMADVFEALTPIILQVVSAVGDLTKFLFNLFNQIREFFGFAPAQIRKQDIRAGASIGAGTRQTGNQDIKSFIAEANKLSFGGPASDPVVKEIQKLADGQGNQTVTLAQIGAKLNDFFEKFPGLINALPDLIGKAVVASLPEGPLKTIAKNNPAIAERAVNETAREGAQNVQNAATYGITNVLFRLGVIGNEGLKQVQR